MNVDCYGVGHVLADRDFIITYASANSIMGINGQVVANAFANSKAAVYQPAVQYDSAKGAKVTVAHLATGRQRANRRFRWQRRQVQRRRSGQRRWHQRAALFRHRLGAGADAID